MKLIWTKSKKPLSVFIRWGLKEEVSHFAMVFQGKVVYQSNLLGCGLEWYFTFKKSCTIVYEIDLPLSADKEDQVWQAMCDSTDGDGYDYPAFAYFCWRAVLLRLFKIPLPSRNKWGKSNEYICVGLAKKLPEWLVPAVKDIPDSEMVSPAQLLRIFETSGLKATRLVP